MSVTMQPLDVGRLTAPHSMWERGGGDEPSPIPVTAWLIRHTRGAVVFDCGMHTDLFESSPKLESISLFFEVGAPPEALVAAQLRALDTDPEQVVAVVASHLHFDHIGGLSQLPNARLLVQRSEWESATTDDNAAASGYLVDEFETGHDVVLLDGEHDVFGDGSLTCIPTPGHTVGHQSLVVRLANATVVLTGDCCYFERTVDGGPLPPIAFDHEEQERSIARLRSFRTAGAMVVPAHDPEFWARRPTLLD